MNPLDLFAQIQSAAKAAQGLKGAVPKGLITTLGAHRWDPVSVNGVHVATVTEHGMSFDLARQRALMHWTFAMKRDEAEVRTIYAEIDPRGGVTIALDDDAQGPHSPIEETAPRIAAHPIVSFSGIKISIELIFDKDGARQDYRFDGRMYP